MTLRSYDKIGINEDILFDLPFSEGVGVITQDIAKLHHPVSFEDPGTGVLSWDILNSGLKVLDFLPAGPATAEGNYLECDSTKTADLDFTIEDYSFGMWMYQRTMNQSQLLAGKYIVNSRGWEIYTTLATGIYYLSLRHHHANSNTTRSSASSVGWNFENWWFVGISRVAGYPLMYRNGTAVEMSYSDGGIKSPESSAADDLVIGARYTKDANWINGKYWRPRIWGRALSAIEWSELFEKERNFFGV